MSKVVFILGAGASRECGAPLMSDFLDAARDLYLSNNVDDKKDKFGKVFDVIGKLQQTNAKANLDLYNIESIFTALELGKVIQKVPGLNGIEDIENSISALKSLIVKTLEKRLLFPFKNNDHISVPKPYDEFVHLIDVLQTTVTPAQTVSVITFNYDIALDFAFHEKNGGIDYVVGKSGSASSYIDVLKLHGSLNWGAGKDKIEVLGVHKFLQYWRGCPLGKYDYVTIPIGSKLQEFYNSQKIAVESEPLIVPPAWNKADYHHALSDVWKRAADHLAEAEYIYIIGYSLPETDSFFRHLYALGTASGSIIRKITVFNPDTTGIIDQRFKTLLGSGVLSRYTYDPSTFSEAIPKIAKDFRKPIKSGILSRV